LSGATIVEAIFNMCLYKKQPSSQKSSYLHGNFLTQCRFKFVQMMAPGVGRGHKRGNHFLYVFILEKSFKIFFSRTIKPEKLKFTLKLPYIVQILVCSDHGPQGSVGATIGETILYMFYMVGKIFRIQPQSQKCSDKFTLKLYDILQIQICSNHDHHGSDEAIMGD
jgi:hypothetical protein